MIKGYTGLKDIVEKHWLVVAYRYMDKKSFDDTFTQEELIEAFKAEGFESREDIWKRVINKCLNDHFESAQYGGEFLEVIYEESTTSSAVDDEIPF